MLDLTHTLFIGTLLGVLVFPVASSDGLSIGRGVRVKNPDVEEGAAVAATPEPIGSNV